ncbi:hypothetical protein [Gimesia maris]|uniref:hypothetical protein n=1 Tax=Gimesia maris TaxID=122 RepID=UPI0030D8476A|tara:strand:- start:30 stop:236 length:207 start_codon:yes stop_codon:yes gene_type:complete
MDVDLYNFVETLHKEDDDTGDGLTEWVLANGRQKMAYVIDIETAPPSVQERLKELGHDTDDTIMVVVQ